MTNSDRPAFAGLMAWLGEAFNEPVSRVRMEAYFDALADLPIGTVQEAVRASVRSCKFFPKPAELRELVGDATADRVELAWVRALQLVRRVGFYGWPDDLDSDVALRTAIDACGGWRTFCSTDTDQFPFLTKTFKGAYAVAARRDALPEQVRALLGERGPKAMPPTRPRELPEAAVERIPDAEQPAASFRPIREAIPTGPGRTGLAAAIGDLRSSVRQLRDLRGRGQGVPVSPAPTTGS